MKINEAAGMFDVSEQTIKNWCEARGGGLFKRLRSRERSRKRMEKFGGAVEWILATDEKPTMKAAAKKFGLDYQPFTMWVIGQHEVSKDVKAAMDAWKDKNLSRPEYKELPPRPPLTRESLAQRKAALAVLASKKSEADKELDALLAAAEGILFT